VSHKSRLERRESLTTQTNEVNLQISNLAKRRIVPAGKGEIASRAIARGGQPYPRSKTPRQLLEFSARHANAICQPEFGGHTRHPVLLPRAALRNGKAPAGVRARGPG
jgi:CTP:molybdopterin cytidylyltransferase MocA